MKEILNKQAETSLKNAVSKLDIRETRPEQIQMAQMILRFLDYSKDPGNTLMIEAGTGVGKSFGYLVPVNEYISANPKSKVVIATNTISLQEQLTRKDAPIMSKLYRKHEILKAKGRNNYICYSKLMNYQDDLFAQSDEAEQVTLVAEWLATPAGENGDRSELGFPVDNKVWNKLCSDSLDCTGVVCPHARECYFNRARARLEKANIIITTHAMVLSDYKTKVLPDYDILIVDEAHNFGKNASSILTININKYRFFRIANMIAKNKLVRGAFSNIKSLGKAEEWIKDLLRHSEDFFSTLLDGRVYEPTYSAENLIASLNTGLILSTAAIEKSELAIHKASLTGLAVELTTMIDEVKGWVNQSLSEAVYWVEKNEAKMVPIVIGQWLAPLWASKTTILTSATLCVDGKFNIIIEALNMDPKKTWALKVNSPFNYAENGLIYCPPKAPSPKTTGYQDYVVATIKDVLVHSKGKTFVLFTSYEMLRAVAQRLREWDNSYLYLVQGEDGRERLLVQYRNSPNTVLLGTDTFWEGVDENIDCVVLTKLPFSVPTNPIEEALYETIKAKGQNPFMAKALPDCALKLKQGTGRLIRNQQKRGVVVICDPRINTEWGGVIKRTLPGMQWTEDLNRLNHYLENA